MTKSQTKESTAKHPSFTDYWNKGISVIPEFVKDFQWSRLYRENYKPTDEEQFSWDLEDSRGWALVTGIPSEIICVDIDIATEDQIKKLIALLGDTPCKRFGSKGIALFYKYNNEKNENWAKNGVLHVELKSTGTRITIPPALHRKTGKPYIWTEKPLIECYDQLPTLPKDYSEIICSLFSIQKETPQQNPSAYYDTKPTHAEAAKALSYCDPNCTRSDWIKIGMAFKSEVGEAGYEDFNSWSASGKTYDKATIRSQWRSFHGHSISYGTLVYFAKLGGYQPPVPEPKVYQETNIDDWEKTKLERKAEMIQKSKELPEFYLNAPTHIKTIVDWILSTSMYPQPIITLGSVLAFLGFMMGRHFHRKSLRPNLYVANIAYSADGKEHINRCIRGLMQKQDMTKFISYGWTSDTAIVEKLSNNDGRAFYLTDELQAALRAIANRSTNSREAAAVEIFLQAYTGVEVRSADYADSKERPTKIVKNPFITICGYTTPAIFEMCLGSTEVFSGFVGRLTVFKGNEYIPEENPNYYGGAWENPPASVTDAIKGVLANRVQEFNNGVMTYGIKEIPTNCDDLIRQYREKIRNKRNEMRMNGEAIEPVFGRAAEMMLKYAMIASGGHEIRAEHVHWAISVVEYNLSIICDVAQGFADNKFERKKSQALQYIQKRSGKIEKSEFTRGCAIFDNGRERDDIIKDLIEAGKIEVIKIESVGKSKTGYRVL